VVTACLGLAEAYRLSGRQFLTSVLAGYELGGRIASYIGPVLHVQNGEVTGFPDVWGVAAPVVVGACAAAARARNLGPATFGHALGLAGSNAPLPCGSQWSSAVDLPNCKYADVGWCAVTGTFAALSAELGSTGFQQILDGPNGLARMCGVAAAEEKWLTEGLGVSWMLDDITYKPWPTCRFTHYSLTALERLLRTQHIDVDSVDEIAVETGPLACSKRFTNPNPVTFAAREFSYPHMVAMRLLNVPPGPRWLDAKHADDPRVRNLKKKVRVEEHPRGRNFATGIVRNQIRFMTGGIRILAAGKTYHAESDYALGDPWEDATRFSDEDIARKFRGLVAPDRAQAMLDAVMTIETLADISPLAVSLRAQSKEPIDA
jgi:2-methylcitrate dehydratase PrpD